jgi:macrodomain Ter protein organizer (MatP/YcbG family)
MGKKKIIELEDAVFKKLSIQAATSGKNLKVYIQDHLTKLSDRKIKSA